MVAVTSVANSWEGWQVLVTGRAGFIGSHLVSGGSAVTVVDNLSTGHLGNLMHVDTKVDLLELDICHIAWGELLAERHDVIIHLAGNAYVPPSVEAPAWDYQTNLDATFRLLEALRQVQWPGKLIYASSAAVYGNPGRIPICEDDPTVPISPYGVAKLAAERHMAVYSQLYGLRTTSLRFFSIYGPRRRKQVVYDLIQKITRDPRELFVQGDGTQTRDFNYVEDTARAATIVAEHGALHGDVYNVASGRECSIQDLVEMLCRILHESPRLVYRGEVRPGDAHRWSVNIRKLAALGYRPKVSLEMGLARTAEWIAQNKK